MGRSYPHTRLAAVVLDVVLLVSSSWARADFGGGGIPGMSSPRILHFPANRSLGRLMIRSVRPEEPVDALDYRLPDAGWKLLGHARGDVARGYPRKLPDLSILEFRSGACFSHTADRDFQRHMPGLNMFRGCETESAPRSPRRPQPQGR